MNSKIIPTAYDDPDNQAGETMPTPLRVLIVEDLPDDAELMLLRLQQDGFQLQWRRVDNAPDYLAALEPAPDLILADWSMPQFSGLRALQLLQERSLDIPFIIVSGSIGEEAAVAAVREGAYDYVLKDRLARLGQAARYALEQKQMREEHQRAEEEREKLQAQLLHAQKMEAIGHLTAGIAHNFNNMLTVINGFAELLQWQMAPEDPLQKYVEKILGAGRDAADLVRRLMVFSRKQELQPQVLELNAAVTAMRDMLRPMIGENIQMETQLGGNLWPVEVDPVQIQQVVVNLAVNARDAMPRGGRLTLATANVVLDQAFISQHPEAIPGNYVTLAISDTGCGMSPEMQAHLFEPFFTTKEMGKGTGLGLATVYGIVKQSGGYIYVDSQVGAGSTFKIYLPRA